MVNRVKKFKKWTGAIGGVADGALNLTDKALNVGEKAMKMKTMMGYKNGGKVKRTGAALLHRGEVVLSVKQVGTLKKLMNQK
jgi:hypothetical protein